MPSEFLVSELITAARDLGQLPPAEESAGDAKLLALFNREQRLYLTKLLLSARESYQTATIDIPVVAGTTRYRLPTRAVGAKLKQLEMLDSGGEPVLLHPFPDERRTERDSVTGPGNYYLMGNTIVLFGTPTSGGTLRATYFRRMNELVDAAEAAEVASFNAVAKTITLVSAPSDWSGTQTYDLIQASPHFDSLAVDQSASLSTLTLTFADDLPEDLAEGDYVALAGETPICQAPLELHDLLAQRVAYMWLKGKGDPRAPFEKEVLEDMENDALSLISPRVEGSPKPLLNFSAPGWRRFRSLRRGAF